MDQTTTHTVKTTYVINGKPVDDIAVIKELVDAVERLDRIAKFSYQTRTVDAVITDIAVRSAERWALIVVALAVAVVAGVAVGWRWF